MAYGDAFEDVYDDVHARLSATLTRLITGTWSATRQELQLSDTQFAEIKARRILATRQAEEHVAQALKALAPVSPDNEAIMRGRYA